MADINTLGEDRAMGVTGLIVMAAIQKLKDKANGLAISERTGLKGGYIYNLLGRLEKRGLIGIERTGIGATKLYSLTPKGADFLNEVRSSIR